MERLTGEGFLGTHHNAAAPPAFAAHPLVRGRLFYTLTLPLLDAIEHWLGRGVLDADLLRLERTLADACGVKDGQVGFWDGWPIYHPYLEPAPALNEMIESLPQGWQGDPGWQGMSWVENRATLKDADQRTAWNAQVSRGYCGWLLTNPLFVREHDDFFARWLDMIRPRASMPYSDQRAQWVAQEVKPCVDAHLELCRRWQLTRLAGPYLPVPLGPQLPVTNLSLMPQTALAGGTLFYFPNTHPLPGRAMLRQMIEDALGRSRAPEHLKEWADLVEASHTGKSTIARYGRLFQLQHYWRALHRRHGDALRGHREELVKAMASVLFNGDDDADDKKFESVKKDLTFLSQRLGASDWYAHACALDHF
jgi:hypothetical protein